MQSKAKTPEEYLAELSDERAKAIGAVRQVILENLPPGYAECMAYGMIGYRVADDALRATAGDPLVYIALASQKHYMALYMMSGCYKDGADEWFRHAYEATGKKLDMGKGCVRFRHLDNLPLDLVAKAVAKVSVEEFVSSFHLRKGKC